MKFAIAVLLAPLFWLVASFQHAEAATYSGTTFQIHDPVLQFGGGRVTSGTYRLFQSVGEVTPGRGSGTQFGILSGFLGYPEATAPVLSGTSTSAGQVTLTWTASVGRLGWNISGYDVCSGTTSNVYTCTNVGNVLTRTQAAAENVLLFYRVRARDTFGNPVVRSNEIILGAVGSSGAGTGFVSSTPPGVPPAPAVAPAPAPAPAAAAPSDADLNDDGRVDLADLSTILFWFEEPTPPASVDLSRDGVVDLIDLSMTLGAWTDLPAPSPPTAPAAPTGGALLLLPVSPAETGEVMRIELGLDTGGNRVNSVRVTLTFPAGLNFHRFESGGSLVSFWTEPPTYNPANRTLSFSGGILGGFNGQGILGAIEVVASADATIALGFDSSSLVLLADGRASRLGVTLEGLVLEFRTPTTLEIISETHPDELLWYPESDFVVKLEETPEEVVSFLVDRSPATVPDTTPEELAERFEIALPEGISYLHVRRGPLRGPPESWGEAAHYQVKIDQSAPEVLEVAILPRQAQTPALLLARATDAGSGVASYEVSYRIALVDRLPVEIARHTTLAPTVLERVPRTFELFGGTVLVRVRDAAGNLREERIELTGKPLARAGVFGGASLLVLLVMLSVLMTRRQRPRGPQHPFMPEPPTPPPPSFPSP